jgi:nicotinate-nucleotide adenylyltransferase
MRIGFFGGSFDPPHLGHLAVARAAAKTFALDRVLFAPTAHQPLKPDGAVASFQDRLAMVSLLCELEPRNARAQFEPSSLDAPLPDGSPNYTVNTLSALRAMCAVEDTVFVLIGADAFLGLPRWRSSETLLDLAEWIVVSRPGVSLREMEQLALRPEQMLRVHWLRDIHEPASATDVRSLLSAGSDCEGLLPASVLHYIRAHHLYET